MHIMLKMETMKWENTKIRVSCADVFSPLLCVGGDSRCAFPIYVTEAPCLFRHLINGVTFVLMVDDIGVKFQNTQGRDHFLNTLRALYAISVDYEGSQYLGMSIAHDRAAQTISISMPGYVARVLELVKFISCQYGLNILIKVQRNHVTVS